MLGLANPAPNIARIGSGDALLQVANAKVINCYL